MGSSGSSPSVGDENEARANAVAAQVEEVFQEEEEWKMLMYLLKERRSKKHLRHYRKDMWVKRLFRIKPNDLLEGYREEAARQNLGKPELLFHGTTPSNAERIVLAGFEMPTTPGMFGRGVYFAKDPLKSIGYARLGARSSGIAKTLSSQSVESPAQTPDPSSWFGLTSIFQSFFGRERPESVQHMLLCDVYLGHQRTLRRARPNFDPNKGLKRWEVTKVVGAQDYNSVRAPGGTLGCVKVTEYVIYQECQAIPRFLIEFDQVSVRANLA